MSCPSQHLKWLEQNILQEKQWMEQLQECKKASKNIAVKAPCNPPSCQMQKKRRFRPGNCCSERDLAISEVYRPIDQKGSIPTSCI